MGSCRDRIVAKIVFPVADLEGSAEFYRSLGFRVQRGGPGYAWVTHQGEEILHLALTDGLDRAENRAAGYLHVQDADRWHSRWSTAGVDVGPIEDRPWEMREFSIEDPDGNLLRVGQNL